MKHKEHTHQHHGFTDKMFIEEVAKTSESTERDSIERLIKK